MNRYHHKDHATYCYRDKKSLITDLCEEMQRVRKEYLEHKKERGFCNTYWLNKKFELMVGKHIEWWHFSIYINDVMGWPTAGGSVTNTADWAICPEMGADGEKVTDFKTAYTKADLAEGKLFRKGKKTFVKVIAE